MSTLFPAEFDVADVLSNLTIEEKIALVSGSDAWHTAPVHRLGIPKVRMTDGPNGVRGTKFFNGVPAACLPCGTALGATWDTELVRKAGELQGREAMAKGASVILGPTVNMQRSPLGGRGFESISEDPVLAGNLAAASINGIQSLGVIATLKHLVCNDQEHERMAVNSVVSDRALREIYLMPFQVAERDAHPMAYMTSYNKVNGTHCSEDPRLIQHVLRDEWGFRGLVMSDWYGTYSTVEAIKAGLDLEMPGPTFVRGGHIKQALSCGKLLHSELDSCVRRVLHFVKTTMALAIPEDAEESGLNTPETAAQLRAISSQSIVLLKNERELLPLGKNKTTAVIGPNAAFAAYCGGGSASLLPYYAISPLDGIRRIVPEAEYQLGVPAWKKLPLLHPLVKARDGRNGLDMKVFLEPHSTELSNRTIVDDVYVSNAYVYLGDYKNSELLSTTFYAELTASFQPQETSKYEFSLSVAGTAQLFVDNNLLIDNETEQTAGDSFFAAGTIEEIRSIRLEQGRTYQIRVTFGTLPTRNYPLVGASPYDAGGLRIGCYKKIEPEKMLNEAIALAKSVDQVVLCVGLNSDWESEGYDRSNMDLPPGSDDLVHKIIAANSKTVCVVQSGTPVTMPWLKDVPALIQAWYGGNETGSAIADVLFGKVNPSGKLPLSFPIRNQDNPAFLNYRSERGRTVYGEDVYVGYRFYEKCEKDVSFPFGFGLSYTTFVMSDLGIEDRGETILVSVDVQNAGKLDGSQVVQVYVSQTDPSLNRPVKELKGFTKLLLQSGASARAEISLIKKYACSFWDEHRAAWIQEKGEYTVLVGDSSANVPLVSTFRVESTIWWNGV